MDIEPTISLFSWEDIPGNDSEILLDFLKKKYGIDWVKTPKIEKIDNDKIIKITADKNSADKNYVLLSLNNEKKEVHILIDNGKTLEINKCIAKTEDGKLNIYPSIYQSGKWRGAFMEGIWCGKEDWDPHGKWEGKGKWKSGKLDGRWEGKGTWSKDNGNEYEGKWKGNGTLWANNTKKLGSTFTIFTLLSIIGFVVSKISDRADSLISKYIPFYIFGVLILLLFILLYLQKLKGKWSATGKWKLKNKRYLFSWDDIPGNDNGRLIEFLKKNFGIDWAKNAKIEKIDDGKTIKVSAENNLSLKLDDEQIEVILNIAGGRTKKFFVKKEDSKLNIYHHTYILTLDENPKSKAYLFNWDDIPGNDNERLIEFLKKNFGIDWVKTAKIEKSDDCKTIKVSTEKKNISLKLNDEKNEVIIDDDARTDKFVVKKEDSKRNIYSRKKWTIAGLIGSLKSIIAGLIGALKSIGVSPKSGAKWKIAGLKGTLEGTIEECKDLNDSEPAIPLFSWEDIPGNDNDKARLKEYLKKKFQVDWANIVKLDDRIIKVIADRNYVLLSLNDEKTEVHILFDNGKTQKTEKWTARNENNKINIYPSIYQSGIWKGAFMEGIWCGEGNWETPGKWEGKGKWNSGKLDGRWIGNGTWSEDSGNKNHGEWKGSGTLWEINQKKKLGYSFRLFTIISFIGTVLGANYSLMTEILGLKDIPYMKEIFFIFLGAVLLGLVIIMFILHIKGNWSATGKWIKNQVYLFSWDGIPGNDNGRLLEFLKQNFGIDWVKTAKIEKIDNDKTIKVSNEINYLSLKLNDEQIEVILYINDVRTDKFVAKKEDSKLNIYNQGIHILTLSSGAWGIAGLTGTLEGTIEECKSKCKDSKDKESENFWEKLFLRISNLLNPWIK